MSGVYVEDPTMRIVDVHWKKKKDDEPPDDGGFGPPLCNVYGWGLFRTDDLRDDLWGVIPYGPHQYPPMTGTFRAYNNYAPDGRPLGGIAGGALAIPVDYLTTTEGLSALNPILTATSIGTGNDYLSNLDNAEGRKGVLWEVPMVGGGTRAGPQVIKGYDINLSWNYPGRADVDPSNFEFGLGLVHPFRGQKSPLPIPSAPFMVLGGKTGASGYFYDFQYAKWAMLQAVATEATQFDPGLGGPAILYFMGRNLSDEFPSWSSTYWFGAQTTWSGDYFTWEIAARCQSWAEAF